LSLIGLRSNFYSQLFEEINPMRTMPVLETDRLRIRPFLPTDTDAVYQLHLAIGWVDDETTSAQQYETTRAYVEWGSMNHFQLARLYQPPYGDRAVELKATHALIGICGIVPYVGHFEHFPSWGGVPSEMETAEVGLMWAISPTYQRQGYATETAQALIDYAFNDMHLRRIIATTEYENIASQGVMQKVGMRLEQNCFTEKSPWFQVIGILENPKVGQ
jgi:ribosomal-protein-alanine N-acetyltransferase